MCVHINVRKESTVNKGQPVSYVTVSARLCLCPYSGFVFLVYLFRYDRSSEIAPVWIPVLRQNQLIRLPIVEKCIKPTFYYALGATLHGNFKEQTKVYREHLPEKSHDRCHTCKCLWKRKSWWCYKLRPPSLTHFQLSRCTTPLVDLRQECGTTSLRQALLHTRQISTQTTHTYSRNKVRRRSSNFSLIAR